MKYVITVLLYIIAILNLLLIGTLVIVATYFFKPRQYDKFVKFLCRYYLWCLFIRIKTHGLENFEKEKTYIFMSNHVNIFDVFLLNGYVPNFARRVEQDRHFNWPFWGKITSRYGTIPINQTKIKSALKSLEKAEEAIKAGTSIIILPEGHRTRSGEMMTFMRGPFLLAQKAKADIVPMAIVGSFEIKKVTNILIKPGTIHLIFCKTIFYKDIKSLTSHELKDFVKDKIKNLIDNFNAPN